MIDLRLCRFLLRGGFRINFLGSLSQLFDLLLNLVDFLCQQVVQSINLEQPNIGTGMGGMAYVPLLFLLSCPRQGLSSSVQ